MGRLTSKILVYLRRIFVCYLLANLVIVTVPRCQWISSAIELSLVNLTRSQAIMADCHETSTDPEPAVKLATIGDPESSCECLLAEYLPMRLAELNHSRSIRFIANLGHELAFAETQVLGLDSLGPEPPYPRFIS